MSPNITTDVLRAQCAELRQQMQAVGLDRDKWRDQSKAILTMLPDRLEKARQNGLREAYTRILTWAERYGGDTVASRTQQELALLGDSPEAPTACKWCVGRGYIQAVCPACRCGLPDEEEE
jgi:hypothetical protein